jgi:hypothetical protein
LKKKLIIINDNKIRCSYGQEDEDDTIKIKIIEQKLTPIYREDLLSEVSSFTHTVKP